MVPFSIVVSVLVLVLELEVVPGCFFCYVFDIIRQGNSVVGKWNKQGTIAIAQQYFLN